jgi:16S rRNA (cytosine967-C5)-methyltransferase
VLAESLIDQGIAVEPSAISPVGLTVRAGNPFKAESFAAGDFYVQDEASQAAALLPPPRPGERVLDAAAAPGGKTFALLAAEPTVAPVMADLAPSRAAVVAANLKRLRRRAPLVVADAGRPPFAAGAFDRVVVDLPCTGTGTLRKSPELKWRISEPEIGRLARQADRLLAGVAPLVAAGGLLVAITCSLEPEENEEVVARCRERRPELVPEPLATVGPPLDRWVAGPGCWRVLPDEDHDGFTVHVLRRIGAAAAVSH